VTAGELTIASRSRTSLASRLAWVAWLATVAMTGVAFAIQLATGHAWIPGAYGFPGFTSLFALSSGSVGALVVARRPTNRIGRVLLIVALGFAFQSLYTEYGIAAYLTSAATLPLADIAAWLVAWAWLPQVILIGPVLLSIFPDGRLLSPRWGLAPAIAAIDGAIFAVLSAFKIGPINNFAIVDNPFGFIPAQVAALLFQPVLVVLAVAFVMPAVSLVIRYRRSDEERRHQLKWIAVAAVILAAVAPLGFSTIKAGQVVFILALCGIPVATGIAILRYRLYDIDTIINRALVYALLTAIIAGIYTASIGVMQRLSNTFLGGSSEATIVVTTVLIVTAFTPIKTRLQTLVDRRFKDAGDARSVIEPFTKALRERTWAIDTRLVLRRFAEALVVGLRAARVEVSQELRGKPPIVGNATGATPAGASWSTTSSVGSVTLRITASLGPHGISARDEEAVVQALALVATELAAAE
jgi:hypothetical protein